MKLKMLLILVCIIFMFTGCISLKEEIPDTDNITIGNAIKIENTNRPLKLLDNKEVLATDGLYYATWVAGDSEPYINEDDKTIDLYDAQLYFLLSKSKSNENAQENIAAWLAAARQNYDITEEKEVSFNGQTYTLLTYNCKDTGTPYDRGISALGIHNDNAFCIELTCRKNFKEDLNTLLTEFLNHCTYIDD